MEVNKTETNCEQCYKEKEQCLCLNFKTMEQRKIIGYKAPCDLFGGKFKKDSLFVLYENPIFYIPNTEKIGHYSVPKEIVETWEACYEEEKIDIYSWSNLVDSSRVDSVIYLKGGKLTQEIIDKIKEVI